MRTKKQNPARQASLSKLQLLQEIEYLKLSLETANSNFENVSADESVRKQRYGIGVKITPLGRFTARHNKNYYAAE